LPITGPIDQVTANSVKRRLKEAVENGAEAIVFEINTPGGELLATLEICRLIKYDAPANTIAWIHPFAFSAGTIIALACREIVVSPDSTFGDSAPVSPLGPIPETERAKLESPILSEVIDSARRRHYDEQLVQAFVSVGVELWLLRNKETGELIFVDFKEYQLIFGEAPPDDFIAVSTPTSGETSIVSPFFEALASAGQPPESDSIAYEQLLPSSRPKLDRSAQDNWTLVGQVVSDDRLLTLKPGDAINYGLVAGVVPDQAALRSFLGASSIRVYHQSWSESLVQFLVSWPVRIVLIIIFLVCLFVEMAMPGTGLFAGGSVIALALLIGAPALAGLAEWWDLLAVLVGIALVAVELLLIPGTLVAGITGAILLMVGIVGTFISGDMTGQEMQDGIVQGILVVLTGSFAAILIIWLISRNIDRGRIGRGIILETQLGKGRFDVVPTTTPTDAVPVGSLGHVETPLRPAGRVRFDDRLLDAVSLGRWIEAGAEVRVVRTGLVLEVEATDS
ncbi:MAG: NfeD family protein, partial [Planctomycetota bacterium]|nr:NfeD family protein [Planctomycetota bacterium]